MARFFAGDPLMNQPTWASDYSACPLMNTQHFGSHRMTYNSILQHPVARNLTWVDVRSMLAALSDTVEEHGDILKVTRHGQSLSLRRPARNSMSDISELMKVRRFLEQTDAMAPEQAAKGLHLLVVINHRQARIYHSELPGSVPKYIMPYEPPESDSRHLHYVEDDSNGQRKPERKSFYEAIAHALGDAEQILIFGSATGSSSAMEHLLEEISTNHHELAPRIVGSKIVDEQHLTENQLLALAREFYATTSLKAGFATSGLPGNQDRMHHVKH